MGFTKAGKDRMDAEKPAIREHVTTTPEGARAFLHGGATLHAYATGVDVGERYVLTGRDAYGRKMRREAGSILAVHAITMAAWGFKRAYHVKADGTRRLVFKR